jgi:hypothetical protein
MAVTLVKPGLVTGLIIQDPAAPTATQLGSGDTNLPGTPANFYIKVMRQSHDFYSPSSEVTGDSDPQPKWENNLLLYDNVSLQGGMVAAQAVGLKNLIDSTKNPLTALHRFDLGGGTASEWLDIRVLIERIRFRWNRTAAYVGLSILCKMTNMATDEITGIEDTN